MIEKFEQINRGYNSVFRYGKLSLGIVIPIENYVSSPIPSLNNHLERVQLVEQLGFRAVWVRDVPFQVPSFGDAGQLYDPFTYLGFLAGKTKKIALGTASIALPLHLPVHVAKAAHSIDQLSDGRLILGVASGDRPSEYPAMNIPFEKRGELFKESFAYLRKSQEDYPTIRTQNYGEVLGNMDILPKPKGHKIPMMITGYSQQSLQWNAENGDGWMNYPRSIKEQENKIVEWRNLIAENQPFSKPFLQPLYIDLQANDDHKPEAIHLGLKIGSNHLNDYLRLLEKTGVNHVALNLRFNSFGTEKTLKLLGKKVLPNFDIT